MHKVRQDGRDWECYPPSNHVTLLSP
jgi:hypothetical protein